MTAAPSYPRPSFPRLSMDAPAPTSSTTTGPLRYVQAVNGAALDRTQKLILLALIEWLDYETWTTFVGTTAMAEACGVHYDTVRDTMKTLQDLGVLTVVRAASGRRAATVAVSLERLDQLRRPPTTPTAPPSSSVQTTPASAVGSVPRRPYGVEEVRRVGPTPTLREPVGSVPDRPYAVGSESSPRRVGPTPTKQTEQREEEEEDRGREAATPSAPPPPAAPAPPTPTAPPTLHAPSAIAYRVLAAAWPRPLGANERRKLHDLAGDVGTLAAKVIGVDVEVAIGLAIGEATRAKRGDVGTFFKFESFVNYVKTCLDNWGLHGLTLEHSDVPAQRPGRDRAAPSPAAPAAPAPRGPLDVGAPTAARAAATAEGGARRPGRHLPGSKGYRAADAGAVRSGGAGGGAVGGSDPVPPAGPADGRGG